VQQGRAPAGHSRPGPGRWAPARQRPIRATTVLIATVVPSCTRISASTPAVGAGISASTLSVEISKIGSSRLTASPAFFIQREMVPSAIDSPIWGMITSTRAMGAVVLSLMRACQYAAIQRAARTMSLVCGSTKSSSAGA